MYRCLVYHLGWGKAPPPSAFRLYTLGMILEVPNETTELHNIIIPCSLIPQQRLIFLASETLADNRNRHVSIYGEPSEHNGSSC